MTHESTILPVLRVHVLHPVRLHGLSHPGRKNRSASFRDGKALFTALALDHFTGCHLALFLQLGKSRLHAARAMGTDQGQVFLDELLQLIPRHGR